MWVENGSFDNIDFIDYNDDSRKNSDNEYISTVNSDSMNKSRIEEWIDSARELADIDKKFVEYYDWNLLQLVWQPERFLTEKWTILTDINWTKFLLISSEDVVHMSRDEKNAYCEWMWVDYLIYNRTIWHKWYEWVSFYNPSNWWLINWYWQETRASSEISINEAELSNLSSWYDKVLQNVYSLMFNKQVGDDRNLWLNIKENIFHWSNSYVDPKLTKK